MGQLFVGTDQMWEQQQQHLPHLLPLNLRRSRCRNRRQAFVSGGLPFALLLALRLLIPSIFSACHLAGSRSFSSCDFAFFAARFSLRVFNRSTDAMTNAWFRSHHFDPEKGGGAETGFIESFAKTSTQLPSRLCKAGAVANNCFSCV